MKLYEERLKLFQRFKEECYDTFNRNGCEDCPAFDEYNGLCYLAGEPLFWRLDAIKRKSTQRGSNRN